MIRIDTSKIENWEEIKKEHKKWCKKHFESLVWSDLLTEPMVKKIIKEKCKFDNSVINEEIPERLSNFILELREVFFISKELKDELEKYFSNNYDNMEFVEIIKRHFIDTQNVKKYENKHWHKYWELCKTDEEKQFYIILFTGKNEIDFTKKFEEIKSDLLKKIDNGIIKKSKENSEKYLKKLLKLSMKSECIAIIRIILGLPEKDNENIIKNLNEIFNYKKFQTEKRHEILSMMGIEVCPYCQRNYITNYIEDKRNNTTADLDHFYSQKEFPYLALSLYNFIPSCQICNRTFKLAKSSHKNDILYPYREGFEDFNVKFKLSEKIIDNIMDKKTPFKVEIDYDKSNNRITNTIDTFKLDKVYEESHNGYLKDMIYNVEKYPESYTDKLGDLFEEDKEKMKYHFQEIIKKPYTDRIEKGEPLAKLTKDIMKELGIK